MSTTLAAEKELKHIGECKGMAHHDHDLVHELSSRVDSYWRANQRIANAEGKADVQKFWKNLKVQEEENIKKLRVLVREEIKKDCF